MKMKRNTYPKGSADNWPSPGANHHYDTDPGGSLGLGDAGNEGSAHGLGVTKRKIFVRMIAFMVL